MSPSSVECVWLRWLQITATWHLIPGLGMNQSMENLFTILLLLILYRQVLVGRAEDIDTPGRKAFQGKHRTRCYFAKLIWINLWGSCSQFSLYWFCIAQGKHCSHANCFFMVSQLFHPHSHPDSRRQLVSEQDLSESSQNTLLGVSSAIPTQENKQQTWRSFAPQNNGSYLISSALYWSFAGDICMHRFWV